MNDNYAVIFTDGLTKLYGNNRGIIAINLDVKKGEVFGYLGPNGAGKTTTIRILLDFIRATRGQATILGLDVRRDSIEVRRHIGYLPGELELYKNLTGEEYLHYQGHLRKNVDWQYVEQLAKRLDSDLSQRIGTLSHGNKQKIGLIQALMNKPQLLILDEPTSGLDPLVQQEFYRLIGEIKAEGRTVFFSSHIMPEVERVCDRVAIIREGKLITIEDVDVLKARALRHLEIHFAAPVPPEKFANLEGVKDVIVENNTLRCTVTGTLDAFVKTAAKFEVINLVSREPNLEEIFLTYYSDRGNSAQ
jgi:ABC-2 type transport system ATP-binding protein